MTGDIRELVQEAYRRQRQAIDEMCERMLTQDGTDCGILVETKFEGMKAWSEVTLSPEVPFGEIHYKEGTIQ